MRVLFDTSAYSAFLAGHREIGALVEAADEIYLNPVVLGELHAGFLRGSRRRRNLDLLNRFLASPRVESLDITSATSERYALIVDALRSAGTPIPANDVWIASTAMEHGLRVITTDQHFQQVPGLLLDCFPVG